MPRDYIPADDEGELVEPTEEEQALFRSGSASAFTTPPDFIPPKDFVLHIGQEEHAAAIAAEAADFAVENAAADEYDAAVEHLNKLDVQSAVAHIEGLPPYLRDVYLRAEADNKARKGVLESFAKPGPAPAEAEESFEDAVKEAVTAGDITKDEAKALLEDEE